MAAGPPIDDEAGWQVVLAWNSVAEFLYVAEILEGQPDKDELVLGDAVALDLDMDIKAVGSNHLSYRIRPSCSQIEHYTHSN
jgi:hypothetical protein